ncbi:MAG: helix-hairpin-helix domain-containing protein [Bacteroidales bacterium]|nr:helix-hairpin-helix domain-containing protein [Bacteroidales bacterium]
MFSFKKISILIGILFLFQIPNLGFAQSEAIQRTIENLTENSESTIDYSELIDELELIEKQPININSTQVEQLYRLFLISEMDLSNIKTYLKENGQFVTIYELLLLDGFTPEKLENIAPYITAEALTKNDFPKLKQLVKYGRHNALMRYQRVLEEPKGFQPFEDPLSTQYLGNQDKYYIKYKYNYSNLLQWGITAEKDAGELFFKKPENEEIANQVNDYFQKGFDFKSIHVFAQNIGIIKQVALGDYHLLFGQGLTLWTGLSYGKSADGVQLKRFESFIKPNTSATENGFLRGAAVHLGKEKWSAVIFYSKNKHDATVQSNDDGSLSISTLLNTGFHRTVSELEKKNLVEIELYGGRFKYNANRLSIGVTAYNTQLSLPIQTTATPDNLFDFSGNQLSNYGVDYSFRIWRAHFYGEAALSSNGGKAFINGVNIPFHSRAQVSLLYRNYAPDYHNLFSAALSENSTPVNEKGFFAGTQLLLSKNLSLMAYADFFSFPWLKYEQDAPSKGVEYRLLFLYDHSRDVQMHFKFKFKQKGYNQRSEALTETYFIQNESKYNWQYQINYRVNERFQLRNRIEITRFEAEFEEGKSLGFMLYQDVNYHSLNQKFSSNTRLALFNTDSFASAIYAYENDVLYAFSIPSYSGKGIRFYQLFSYELNRQIKFWIRYSLSYYPNELSLGSGLDEITGAKKSEIKVQLQIKI